MKQFIFLAVCISCISCHKAAKDNSVAISVLVDSTDSLQLKPDIQKVWHLIDLPNNIDEKAIFRLTSITDLQTNPLVSFEIPSKLASHSTYAHIPNYRKHLVRAFYDSLNSAIASANHELSTISPLGNSEVYRSLIQELAALTSLQTKRTYLLVYSDCMELSDLWNAYGNDTLKPFVIAKRLDSLCSFPQNLNGVTVYFMFKAANRNQSLESVKMMNVFKLLLERGGAKVIIQASNTLSDI